MKTIATYCRGKVILYEETLTDGSLVYNIKVFGSELIPVVDKESAYLLCENLQNLTLG